MLREPGGGLLVCSSQLARVKFPTDPLPRPSRLSRLCHSDAFPPVGQCLRSSISIIGKGFTVSGSSFGMDR